MTKAEREALRAMQNMTCFRDEALLKMPRALDALDAKDALIAELITITQRAFEMQTDFYDVERFAALKARAGE